MAESFPKKKLLLILNIIGIEPIDCIDALSLPTNDFEDAMVTVCAKKINADFIVTRDEKFIKENTTVKTVTPEQLIENSGEPPQACSTPQ